MTLFSFNKMIYFLITIVTLIFSCDRAQSLTVDALKNGQYHVKEWDSDKIFQFKFANGEFTRGKDVSADDYFHIQFQKAIIDDFSGKGEREALVIFSTDKCGSSSGYTLAFVVNRDGKLTNVDFLDLPSYPEKIDINQGIINAEFKTYGPDDPKSSPSVKELWRLKIESNKIVKLAAKQESLDKNINLVKDGILPFDKSITVGNALDNYEFFERKKWDFEEKKGRKMVVFRGDFNTDKLVNKWMEYSHKNETNRENTDRSKKELVNIFRNKYILYIAVFYLNTDLSGFSIGGTDIVINNNELSNYNRESFFKSIYNDEMPLDTLMLIIHYLSHSQ
jgi:hypothetical protein